VLASIAHSPPAKQLKKAWVQTAKIKSKWKAQKRREAVLSSHSGLDADDELELANQSDSEITAKNKSHPPEKKTKHAEGNASVANKEQNQSLRDLFRRAYSKDSLHTYKSHPLKKRRGGQQQQGSRKGNAASTTRGQPNMKLRMHAILEKIKQDYSVAAS